MTQPHRDTPASTATLDAPRHQAADLATIPSADETLDALRLLDDDAIHPLAEKLTENARNLVETMVLRGCTAAKAAAEIGLSRATAHRIMAKPEVRAYLKAAMEVELHGLRPQSLSVVGNALEAASASGASAAHIRAGIEAARFLNGEEGRAGVNVNVAVHVPGYVIDLTPQPQVIDITPEREGEG